MKNVTLFSLILFSQFAFAVGKKVDLSKTLFCSNKEMLSVEKDENASKIDRIVVQKKYRKLYLMNQNKIVKSYDIAMGPNWNKGPKQFQGDNKTPEGLYEVELKNPKSSYYLALRVSYPNKADVQFAEDNGRPAGGDIMIHGFPVKPVADLIPGVVKDQHPMVNWTQGCMAVSDREIEEIFSLVDVKTTIEICPL